MTSMEDAIQCGDRMTTPRRSGKRARSAYPQWVSAGPVSPASMANSGAPCETNSAGSGGDAEVADAVAAGTVTGKTADMAKLLGAMTVGLHPPRTKPPRRD